MKKFGFIGAGKMASAIVKGLLSKAISSNEISCTCGNDDTGKILAEQTSIECVDNVKELLEKSRTVVLACKPQQLTDVAQSASNAKNDMLISILAGTSINRLRECFPNVKKIVRVMPNMPAQISQGMSCYAPENELSAKEKGIVENVLGAIGEFIEVQESRLDAVTALSGSGPGYIFEFAAAMIEGAKAIGFSNEEAKKLVEKTMLGSAMLLVQSQLSADELCTAVSSTGGTTLAGLAELKNANFRKTMESVLMAAKKRSEELSKL
ncbi:MAG: pyrroline-5-carboxylate reductase [Opitutales bacterium]|nr:pyrroline-5-carboxylate reductase [Opitutales bacterium]